MQNVKPPVLRRVNHSMPFFGDASRPCENGKPSGYGKRRDLSCTDVPSKTPLLEEQVLVESIKALFAGNYG